jgi:hypothetical protein
VQSKLSPARRLQPKRQTLASTIASSGRLRTQHANQVVHTRRRDQLPHTAALRRAIFSNSIGTYRVMPAADEGSVKPASGRVLRFERLMHECDRDRAFAHGRCNPLHVAAARVTDGEDTGATGFEQIRGARQWP